MDAIWDHLYPAFQAEALPANAASQAKLGQLVAKLVAHLPKSAKR